MGSRTRGGDRNNQSDRGANLAHGMELTAHDRMRDQLARDVEAFLAKGGEIQHLEPHVRAASSDSDQDAY